MLLHPEYLRDRSGSSLLVTLLNNGVKVAAYGWEPAGFARELIEGAGITHFIMGPTAQGQLDPNALTLLVAEMQGGGGARPALSPHGIMVRLVLPFVFLAVVGWVSSGVFRSCLAVLLPGVGCCFLPAWAVRILKLFVCLQAGMQGDPGMMGTTYMGN